MSDFDFDAQLEEAKNEYIEKSLQDLEQWELLIIKLKELNSREETTKEMFREIHSLKGSSGTYGLEFVAKVCHKFEESLSNSLKNGISNMTERSIDTN